MVAVGKFLRFSRGRASPVTPALRNRLPVQVTQEARVQSPGREEPLEEGLAARSSIPARGPHEQRSLAGGSPWGRRESDTTEQLNPQDLEGCACLHRSCIVTSLVSLLEIHGE